MKKLLALVLCVMLFVSVIPTSAFAADSGILWPAVQQSNSLYNKLGQFAGATAVTAIYNGYNEMATVFKPGSNASEAAKDVADQIAGVLDKYGSWNALLNQYITKGASPEGIYKMIGGDNLVALWETVGIGVVADCKAEEAKVFTNIVTELGKIVFPEAPVFPVNETA